jgi:arylsulfatase A-like enzyme
MEVIQPPTQIVLITIDTLRADRVGAYGWQKARTPAIDALAARGARFQRAYATAPITLVSHASLLTGLYPQGHGARHNGMRVRRDVKTLAAALHGQGFNTAAFVAAYPLDHRFGLDSMFDTYDDGLGRDADGRPRNERPGSQVVDAALAWLATQQRTAPIFLWVHLFEPHAPYEGDPTRSASDRYDDEIAKADAQVARLVQAVEARETKPQTSLIVVAGDHGEAFGEHGEIGHSVFVYDTTLRVPLIFAGRVVSQATVDDPVSLVDVMPTILELASAPKQQVDGVSLAPYFGPSSDKVPARALYAESFAPLYDFG